MTTRRRAVATILTALAVAIPLAGCDDGKPKPFETRITHKEYIPASIRQVDSCSGGVPSICSTEKVLEKQCWRLDLELRFAIETDYSRERARREGKPPYWTRTDTRCVFPSEFERAEVGDKFVEPAVKY